MSLGRRIVRGSALSYCSLLLAKLVAFGSTLILVRLLVPRDFGLVGYALVVLGFLDVVKDLGVTAALIYRQDIPDEDAGEAFVLAVAMALVLFAACWILAPVAATFFHDGRITLITRVLGLTLVLDALGGVHAALLQRRMRFGRFVIPDLIQSFTKASVAIGTALVGAGYWCLVWGQLAGVTASTISYWGLFPWRPRLKVRWASARPLLGYGLQIVLVDILGAFILTIDNLIVGRLLGTTALGLYALAFTIPQMLTIGLAVAVSTAVFPAFASIQRDRPALQRQYLSVQHYTAMVLLPVGVGLFSVAPALVHALYRPAWWPMIPAMQLLAIFAALQGLVWSAGDTYKAVGRPDILWKIGLAQMPVLVAAVVIGAELDGIVGVAVARISVVIPVTLVSLWWVRRVLGIHARAIMEALRVPFIAAGAMLGATELLRWVLTPHLAAAGLLVLQVFVGIVVFVAVVVGIDQDLRARLLGWRQRRPGIARGAFSAEGVPQP